MAGKPSEARCTARASVERARVAGAGHLETDLAHRGIEQLAVLGLLDGLDAGADELDVVLVEDAGGGEREREVERGLPAERGQERVGTLLGDDLLADVDGERLDVGTLGQLRVGHDRRRIGVDEDDLVSLLAQRTHALGTGIVELAGLTDDDRARADEHDFVNVGAARHFRGGTMLTE